MALRILHVVPGLGVGGAETNLVRLLEACADGYEHRVVDLGSGGPMLAALQELGVAVVSLNLGRNPFGGMLRLRKALKDFCPQIIQGWLYKGNLLASVAGAMLQPRRLLPRWWSQPAFREPVIWSVRHSLHAWDTEHPRLRLLVRLLGGKPFAPSLVIYNADSARQAHASLGYARYPSSVIGNLISQEQFQPNAHQRKTQRQALGAGDDDLLVGFVGRQHKLKNLAGFLVAAQQLHAQLPNLRIVLAGEGLDGANLSLNDLLTQHALCSVTQLLGPVAEPNALYNALDLLISPSLSEANSNVLLEALACGCACVATDVGSARQFLAAEQLVPTTREQVIGHDLAAAALPLLQDAEQRAAIAAAAAQRVLAQCDAAVVSATYQELYQAAAGQQLDAWAAS